MLSFMMIPFDETFFADVDGVPQPEGEIDIIMVAVSSIVSGVVSAILFYFIGKKLVGNSIWKKVFSVVFHTYVPTIPMMIVLSILIFLMVDSLASLDKDMLMSAEFEEELELSIFGQLIGYALSIAV